MTITESFNANLLENKKSAELLCECKTAELVKVFVINNNNGNQGDQLLWVIRINNSIITFNYGYDCRNDISRIILSLPTQTPLDGSVLAFKNSGIAGFKIQQSDMSHRIRLGNTTTTLGVAGAINSYDLGDYLRLEYIIDEWVATEIIGNFEVL
jgi:hypothetical protein